MTVLTTLRLFVLVLLAAAGCRACAGGPAQRRETPTCALQDCATGKIIDNGCSSDGHCLSCINACPGDAVPAPPN